MKLYTDEGIMDWALNNTIFLFLIQSGSHPYGPAALSLHTEHEGWMGEVVSYGSHVTNEDFAQPAGLYKVIGRNPGHRGRLVEIVLPI
ncbi:hypothetical protein N7504_007649 [Penicillium tannophilum]|nr:hypothetical protein N7504_007649 [Penicillium tannophilum]